MKPPNSHVTDEGNVWLSFAPHPINFSFSSLSTGVKGYEAHCEVFVGEELAELGKLDLLDIRQREYWAGQLQSMYPGIGEDWKWGRAFVMATEVLRQYFSGGDKLVEASQIPYVEPPPPLIDPLIGDTINLWAGHGGSLKSILSIMAAYQVSTGVPIIGEARGPVRNALILDYEELDEQRFGHRYRLISNIYPRPQTAGKLFYRSETLPITGTADTIRRLCDQNDIGFVVIDPLINARGGAAESSSDTAQAFMAIRSLGRPGSGDRPFAAGFG